MTIQNSRSNSTSFDSSYYALGCVYFDKRCDEDYVKSLELFMKGSEEEECAACQNKIGNIYDYGLGVEKDYTKAMEWYLKAAENGQYKAQFNLGLLFENGFGVEQDYSRAMEWYLKSAENGNFDAENYIGILYNDGVGVEQDYAKAMEWYLKAAEHGYGYSQYNIGVLYHRGRGVQQDYSKAIEWYFKSAETGNINAQYNIGNFYDTGRGVEQDYSKAMEWYLKAAEHEHVCAQINIGVLYESGNGCVQDYSKAIEWYLKAAENNDSGARSYLGYLYLKGENGVEKELKKAIFWSTKSLDNNFTFIEAPFEQFAIQEFDILEESSTLSIIDETVQQVIIRFEERDFKISSNFLIKSKYLSAMLSSNWKDFNEKHGNEIILDLRSIQNDIYQEPPTNHIQVFEKYLNYLTHDTIDDFEMKIKLIDLAMYLGDDECILRIVKEETFFKRFYILFKLERVEPLHTAIASCFATRTSINTISDISKDIMEFLSNQSEISSKAKNKILKIFEKKHSVEFPKSSPMDEKIIHVKLSKQKSKKELKFNNQDISFYLKSFEENEGKFFEIISSHKLEFFGSNIKCYVHLTTENEDVGFWLDSIESNSNSIFKIPEVSETDLINLIDHLPLILYALVRAIKVLTMKQEALVV